MNEFPFFFLFFLAVKEFPIFILFILQWMNFHFFFFFFCNERISIFYFVYFAVNAKVRKDVRRNIKVSESDSNLRRADETCLQQHVAPPTLPNAIMTTSYVFNKYISRYIMVAIYTCVGGYKLANKYANKLYCSNSVWTAVVRPLCKSGKCIPPNEISQTINSSIWDYIWYRERFSLHIHHICEY